MAKDDRIDTPRVDVYSDTAGAPPVRPSAASDERSLGELLSDLVQETRTLVRQEIELAKTEASEKASKAGRNIGYAAAGGFVAYAGFIVFLIGLGALLAELFGDDWGWLGYAAVGFVVIVIGALLLQKGLKTLKQQNFSLERTAETLKEDKEWLKEEVT